MRPSVLLFGGIDADRTWLQSCLGDGYRLLEAGTHSEANGSFARQRPACAIVRESSPPALRALAARCELPLLLLSDAPRADAADEVWYVLGRWLPAGFIRNLIESAGRGGSVPRFARDVGAARYHDLLTEPLRRLARQRDLRAAEQICVSIVSSLATVSRAECLFFDSESGTLWSEAGAGAPGTERRAVAGLVGYVARTGARINVPAAAADPCWVEQLDGGQGGERLLAVPIVGQSDQVHAVLVGWRSAHHPPFAADDEARLEALAERVAPLFDQISHELEATEIACGERRPGLFRAEALQSRLPQSHGSLLRMPRESPWLYVALAGLFGCASGLIGVGRADTDAADSGCIQRGFRSISEYACELTGWVPCREKGSAAGRGLKRLGR
jgi:hypothetical protein